MKRFVLALAATALIAILIACGGGETAPAEGEQTPPPDNPPMAV